MGSSKGRRRMILGHRYLINLNYSGGVRKSPGGNWRSSAVKACAKGKPLSGRKACFAASYAKPAGIKTKKK